MPVWAKRDYCSEARLNISHRPLAKLLVSQLVVQVFKLYFCKMIDYREFLDLLRHFLSLLHPMSTLHTKARFFALCNLHYQVFEGMQWPFNPIYSLVLKSQHLYQYLDERGNSKEEPQLKQSVLCS